MQNFGDQCLHCEEKLRILLSTVSAREKLLAHYLAIMVEPLPPIIVISSCAIIVESDNCKLTQPQITERC